MLRDDITRIFIAFLISISILIFNDLAILSIMGIGIFVFTFTIILVLIDFIVPQDLNKITKQQFPNGTDIFINLFTDISEFLILRSWFIIFVIAQSYICIDVYDNYIENKTLIQKGKITQGFDLHIKENYYVPSGHTNYKLYFRYFNKDKNRTVTDIADKFGVVREMRAKTTTKIIYSKDKAKVYDSVIYELQPYRIIIELLFIFILASPLLIYILFISWRDNDYKVSLKGISNWFKELFGMIFTIPILRDDYRYQNFKAEFQLLVQTLKANQFLRIFFTYVVINFLLNNILIYTGYFDIQKLKDTSTPIYFKVAVKPIKTFIRGERYLHIYKIDGKNIVIDSISNNPKDSYIGHIVPTYDYLLRLDNDKDIVKDLITFTLKEYSFISRFFYPYYLPFYKYDSSYISYKLYGGFEDYKQDILTRDNR